MARSAVLPGRRPFILLLAALVAFTAAWVLIRPAPVSADAVTLKRYTVVFSGRWSSDGSFAVGGNDLLNLSAARSLVQAAGGTITLDLSQQIGVIGVESSNVSFAETLRASGLVEEVAEEFVWKAYPSLAEAASRGVLTTAGSEGVCPDPDDPSCPPGGPEPHEDPLEPAQWNMIMIRTAQAHAIQAGSPAVEVGILDTGIDGVHVDFVDPDGAMYPGSRVPFSNVNCAKGRDFVPLGPGAGPPDACTDNNFHGTHVAGIVAARGNEHGVVGVAPNAELIPVKVCDAAGYCYSNSTVAGITYAGDAHFEVINMSFFVDDDQFLASTQFKCASDPVQSAFRRANERAIQYARNQGVVPVAALGNSNTDLAHPPEGNECETVPAETQGVIGTMALGPTSEKAYYSSYGVGMTDVAAPGGNSRNPRGELPGPCGTQVLSTIPGNSWGCFQGTSMASPHTAGVAALIVSQFGRIGNDAGTPDVVMRPTQVENYLQSTTIDLYSVDPTSGRRTLLGYDACFGNGRIDAVKAVTHDTSTNQPEDRQAVEPPVNAAGCPTFD